MSVSGSDSPHPSSLVGGVGAELHLGSSSSPVRTIDVDAVINRPGQQTPPSPPPGPNDLTVNMSRADANDNNLAIDIRRVDAVARKTIVFNDLGSTASQLTIKRSKQDQIDQAYRKLRELATPAGANKCSFNLSKMTVRYELGGVEHLSDLQELVEGNQAIREAYETLDDLVQPIWGGPTKSQLIEKGSKSSSNSAKPMVRNTEALIAPNLPKVQYADTAKLTLELYAKSGVDAGKQQEALKRITGVEKLINLLITHLTTEIGQAEASLSNPATPAADKPGIQANLREMNALKTKLDADRLGLYVAVAFAPHPRHPNSIQALADANRAAKIAQEILQEHLESVRDRLMHKNVRARFREWKFLPEFIRGKEDPIYENKEYGIDVAGLIFSSLPIALARKGYLDYIQGQQSIQKIEGIEDAILRFALAGDQSIPSIDSLIERLSNGPLKLRMQQTFTQSKTDAQNILNGRTDLTIPNAAGTDFGAQVDRLKAAHFP